MKYCSLYFLIVTITLAIDCEAEVYRWTDKEGKVHFGDKKPDIKAEDITKKVSIQNIDTSTEELHKMENVFRKENDADRAHQQQLKLASEDQQLRCENARAQLKRMEGRVQYLDDAGKPVNVSVEEHKRRVAAARDTIDQYCNK
jgi:regulatory protein YycI of two-component signal transduction system YycFG